MQVGDEVWIVHGGRMPLIFCSDEESYRPPNSEANQKCHKFVGDSYIYSIMDGEAARDLEANSGMFSSPKERFHTPTELATSREMFWRISA
jgi:hypothetical protein